jgi:plasmid stabilization system protein ParE
VAIWNYLEERNPQAAVSMDQLFSTAADRLADFPEQGRIGIVTGTRELFPHENYRLVYELEADVVWILALVHTSRLWPPE